MKFTGAIPIDDISKQLMDYPARIHDAEKCLEDADETYRRSREISERVWFGVYLLAKEEKVTDGTAKAKSFLHPETIKARDCLLAAESARKKAYNAYHQLENEFAAIRKVAEIEKAKIYRLGQEDNA